MNKNIVYIGDEVEIGSDSSHYHVVFYTATDDCLTVCSTDKEPFSVIADLEMFTTPDKKPVTGFGGANVRAHHMSELADAWVPLISKKAVGPATTTQDNAIQMAVAVADAVYGPWQRPFTEADRKRRGLL